MLNARTLRSTARLGLAALTISAGLVACTPTVPPGTTTTTTTPAPVVAAVSDAFLGGTWTRSAPVGGAWGSRTVRPSSAVTWLGNGTRVSVECMAIGGAYSVSYAGGATQTWVWHARLTDGTWVRSAVLFDDDGNAIGRTC